TDRAAVQPDSAVRTILMLPNPKPPPWKHYPTHQLWSVDVGLSSAEIEHFLHHWGITYNSYELKEEGSDEEKKPSVEAKRLRRLKGVRRLHRRAAESSTTMEWSRPRRLDLAKRGYVAGWWNSSRGPSVSR
ncbi:Hypothetical protein FKW44_013093, partial [Caligus rogercresseyi]